MDDREKHLNRLRLAEQQFRLACTVNLAVINGVQTLDVPVEWTFGRHRVSYDIFGLRSDQADLAAAAMEATTTLMIAVAVLDAIKALIPGAKTHDDRNVVAAYQISRMIRNAFAHSMLAPRWSIDPDCRDRVFAIDEIISIDTGSLNEKPFEWQDYGGPLAIFYFGRFVREKLLNDEIDRNRKKPPYPSVQCYQQGRFLLRRIGEADDRSAIPENATLIATAGPGESIDLGDGHSIYIPRQLEDG